MALLIEAGLRSVRGNRSSDELAAMAAGDITPRQFVEMFDEALSHLLAGATLLPH